MNHQLMVKLLLTRQRERVKIETKCYSSSTEDFSRCLKDLGIRALHIFPYCGENSGTGGEKKPSKMNSGGYLNSETGLIPNLWPQNIHHTLLHLPVKHRPLHAVYTQFLVAINESMMKTDNTFFFLTAGCLYFNRTKWGLFTV